MKKASIISIGNELLNGQTVDTNTTYLSSALLELGIPVVSSYSITDNIDSIARCLNYACDDADLILLTGGLGPTDDDVTRQGFADFLGAPLKLDEKQLAKIQDFFAGRNLKMPEKNKIQAYIPEGTKPLDNNIGTAPGIIAQKDDKTFVLMPGVPAEMKKMFEESVLPKLKNFASEQAIVTKKINCFGTGESNIAEILGPLMKRNRNPLINITAGSGIIKLHIIATAKDIKKAQELAKKDENKIRELLGDIVFSTGQQSLAETVGKKLAEKNLTLCLAESCTGGLIAKLITDVPGASRYFTQGWITYSNQAKINELAVEPRLIEKYGAVSEQVAQAMAKGAREKAHTTFAIAVTGIAGPNGSSEQKPLGLVYICVDSNKDCENKRFIFSHDRAFMRARTALTALNMLRLKLEH
jgi:nicotinamide-nucleotide amidase